MQKQKCSMRACVWPPRSASLPFRDSSLSRKTTSLNKTGTGPPEFLYIAQAGCPEGLPGRLRRLLPPSLWPCVTSRPRTRPLTPLHRPVCRPHRVMMATADKKSNRHAAPATFTTRRTALFFFFLINFCVSYFGSPPAERRSSDISITCISGLGAVRVQVDNKKEIKTRLFPVTRPHVYSQNTISRCQGKSRSGRPVALFGAPLNLPRVYRLARV